MHRLRILHISDLHERGSRETDPWRRRRVFGDAWDWNLTQFLQDGPIDLVCFTGDAADWGLPAEYEAATAFFTALLERLSLKKDRLFVIPGNHDVEQKRSEAAWKGLRKAVANGVDRLDLSHWMVGKAGPPLGVKAPWREQILERQAAYRDWVAKGLGRPELAVPLSYRVRLHGLPFPFHVIGVNTAWLCGDNHDAKKLLLTENQIMDGASHGGEKLNGFRLLLMHHPFDELADGAECRRLAADYTDLVLRGHLHEPEVQTVVDPDRKLRQLAAGCLYEGHRADQYSNACHAITLTLDNAGWPVQADVRVRSWTKNGHWFDDRTLYRNGANGRFTLPFDSPQARAATGNPFDPWTPRPDTFAGRVEILRRLELALLRTGSFSLFGDWRIGKTMLVEEWARRLRGMDRTAILLSGEMGEASTPARFVHKVTGMPAPDDVEAAAELLSQWAERSPNGPPVILMDETDSAVRNLPYRFFERLRGMLGRVVLVFSSRKQLDELFKEIGSGSPFQNRLEEARLGLLDDREAEQIVGRVPEEHRSEMRRWAGRHPFYLQLFGHYLVDALRNGRPAEAAMDPFRQNAYARLKEWWRLLDDREQEELRRTASGVAAVKRSLRNRGIVTEAGLPFGEILTEWMREEL